MIVVYDGVSKKYNTAYVINSRNAQGAMCETQYQGKLYPYYFFFIVSKQTLRSHREQLSIHIWREKGDGVVDHLTRTRLQRI